VPDRYCAVGWVVIADR